MDYPASKKWLDEVDNNEELFSIVTSLNKKLENLKKKRLQLESKVDDLIFVNNNSDGYYYSFFTPFCKLLS